MKRCHSGNADYPQQDNCLKVNNFDNQVGLEDIVMTEEAAAADRQWFVLRDLTRPIAKLPGYMRLQQAGIEVFTPMKWTVSKIGGKKVRRHIPVIHDLLFAHATRAELDPVIERTDTLQYRFMKGHKYREPMTVGHCEMDIFIAAVSSVETPEYYTPGELTTLSYGKKIRLICDGIMNGYEGRLLSIKGSRKKRLIVEIPGFIAAAIEIEPQYIEFI